MYVNISRTDTRRVNLLVAILYLVRIHFTSNGVSFKFENLKGIFTFQGHNHDAAVPLHCWLVDRKGNQHVKSLYHNLFSEVLFGCFGHVYMQIRKCMTIVTSTDKTYCNRAYFLQY